MPNSGKLLLLTLQTLRKVFSNAFEDFIEYFFSLLQRKQKSSTIGNENYIGLNAVSMFLISPRGP